MNSLKEYILMGEVNIMDGIDFDRGKFKQKKIEKNQRIKKNLMNRRLNMMIFISVVIMLVLLGVLYHNLGKNAVKTCQENGNSYEYCIEHI